MNVLMSIIPSDDEGVGELGVDPLGGAGWHSPPQSNTYSFNSVDDSYGDTVVNIDEEISRDENLDELDEIVSGYDISDGIAEEETTPTLHFDEGSVSVENENEAGESYLDPSFHYNLDGSRAAGVRKKKSTDYICEIEPTKSHNAEVGVKHKKKESDGNDFHIRVTEKQNMAQEMICSICMEIIVDATSTAPCGHMYCEKCIGSVVQKSTMSANKYNRRNLPHIPCPMCRVNVNSLVRHQTTDNVILSMVKLGFFPSGEATHFLQRRGITLTDQERGMAGLHNEHGNPSPKRKRQTQTTFEDNNATVPLLNPLIRRMQYDEIRAQNIRNQSVRPGSFVQHLGFSGYNNENLVNAGSTADDAILIDD
eukprot:CAMPEP_0113316036 /NCGR_PEP_ID=MMETSP0010_2-20120614/11458_1 /TAXON_ID=216773 ORGANISM="Corethron hystrix, Strain 308" /NCGR_SAMPLE_ID=MMETSP0010_2 /ASSEMBLY_ACC=CAM_ASM_000155 /LENGTH=365 /DNA_ID=CAMNT_0000172643 /DNA_START=24 /DNA_END=1122 /DNA_ORIENTATION=+ /assembly_acc=CAM_ASM_000155